MADSTVPEGEPKIDDRKLDPRVTVGAVSLTVADLERSIHFYQHNIGLRLLEGSTAVQESGNGYAELGADGRPLLKLYELPGARIVKRVTGLYHFAIRVPSRLELARTLRRLAETETQMTGASDHLVSEALYLSDPDGHGIELYRDRPREGWYEENGQLKMDTLPLDFNGILSELADNDQPWEGIHPESVMGHVHLHVANLNTADTFYVDVLGFEKPPLIMSIPTASFVGAGGYHHHLGLNIWAGAGALSPPEDAARLILYEIVFPDAAALSPAVGRLKSAAIPVVRQEEGWLVQDPSQNRILLRTAD